MFDMDTFLVFASLGLAWMGAYFIATQLFKKVWKDHVTHAKLAGFLAIFSVAFIGLMMIFFYIVAHYVSFGR